MIWLKGNSKIFVILSSKRQSFDLIFLKLMNASGLHYFVAVVHIFSNATGHRQSLTIEQTRHISLRLLLRPWRNLHQLGSFL